MEAVLTNGVDYVVLVAGIPLSKLQKGRPYISNTYVYILTYQTINHDPNLSNIYMKEKIQSYCESIPIEVEGKIEHSVIKSFIPEFDRSFEKLINRTRIKRESRSTCQYRQQ